MLYANKWAHWRKTYRPSMKHTLKTPFVEFVHNSLARYTVTGWIHRIVTVHRPPPVVASSIIQQTRTPNTQHDGSTPRTAANAPISSYSIKWTIRNRFCLYFDWIWVRAAANYTHANNSKHTHTHQRGMERRRCLFRAYFIRILRHLFMHFDQTTN